MTQSTIPTEQTAPLPFSAGAISYLARRWPWWVGRSRIFRYFEAALGQRTDHLSTTLLGSEITLKVPLGDTVGRKAVAFGENDADLFRFLCVTLAQSNNPEGIYVDIGANLGVFLLRVAEKCKIRGVGFEPRKDLAALMNENIAANHFGERVEVRNVAVGSQVGEVHLAISPGDSGVTRIAEESEGYTVPIKTIDSQFTAEEWKNVVVVKIDVEGFELEVFHGMQTLFQIHRPTLVFEVNMEEMKNRGMQPKDLADCLRKAGYQEFWALDRYLYPIKNGMYPVSNVVAVGSKGSSLVSAFGMNAQFTPKPHQYWPVHVFEF